MPPLTDRLKAACAAERKAESDLKDAQTRVRALTKSLRDARRRKEESLDDFLAGRVGLFDHVPDAADVDAVVAGLDPVALDAACRGWKARPKAADGEPVEVPVVVIDGRPHVVISQTTGVATRSWFARPLVPEAGFAAAADPDDTYLGTAVAVGPETWRVASARENRKVVLRTNTSREAG